MGVLACSQVNKASWINKVSQVSQVNKASQEVGATPQEVTQCWAPSS
jgi:hypothetical protein